MVYNFLIDSLIWLFVNINQLMNQIGWLPAFFLEKKTKVCCYGTNVADWNNDYGLPSIIYYRQFGHRVSLMMGQINILEGHYMECKVKVLFDKLNQFSWLASFYQLQMVPKRVIINLLIEIFCLPSEFFW